MNRRTLLRRAAATGAVALAGCIDSAADLGPGDDSDDAGGAGDGNESDPDDGNESDPDGGDDRVRDSSIETRGVDCGDGSERATVSVDGDRVTVRGHVSAPDPCHEATLESVGFEDDELAVDVGVRADDADSCSECVGDLEYEATVDLAEPIEAGAVAVSHRGEAVDVDVADERDSIDDPVVSRSIETRESACGEDDRAEATYEDGVLTVEGTIPAPNPCHEAVLDDVSFEDETVTVSIDVESTGSVCQECVGAVTYRARLEFHEDVIVSSATVSHVGHSSTGSGWGSGGSSGSD